VGELVVGQEGRYRVTVSNDGPTPDPGPLTVTDTLPRGMTFMRAAGDGWSCATSSATTVVCEREEGLGVGGSTSFTLVVEVGPEAVAEAINTVTVTSPAEDRVPANNTASTRDPVTPLSVLALDKSLDGVRGDLATYRLTVTNTGPNDTSETVVLVDRLPQQLTFVSATGPGWSCGAVGQVVTCTHPDVLSVGERSTVVLVAQVGAEPGATIVNVAEVSGGGGGGGSTVTDDAELRVPAAVDLPDTGASTLGQLLIALLLIGLGAVVRSVARRPAVA
jgi:uncharacterized repeat protein (TIGR01451 family)